MKYFVMILALSLLIGCVKTPTRNSTTVDDRPGITFNLHSKDARKYELKIDGISYGSVEQYQQGENLLRVVDGTHVVELFNGENVVLRKSVYLGAGVNRVIEVTP